MAYQAEHYVQNMGTVCERCKLIRDNKSRLIIIEASGGHAYLCSNCIEEILKLLRVRDTYHKPEWTMSKQDFMGWIDPAWRTTGPGPDNLRNTLGDYDEEFRKMGKDFLELKNGYTDRNKFFWDLKAHLKKVYSVVEQYLNKTT